MKNSFKNWQKFYKEFFKNDFQKWPCEPLVRIINGNYLKYKIKKRTNIKVLDVGCGFGNNLCQIASRLKVFIDIQKMRLDS